MSLINIIKKLIYKEKYNSNTYIKHLRKKGITIGNDVIIYSPGKTVIDEQYPWMIKIGNHVRIANGVKIITHDYSWFVLKGVRNENEGAILGASGEIIIGNNVFIGVNSIILRNVKIGDNVVIGAGSVVTKDCLGNSVYAGSPAKRIMSIDDYYKKRLQAQLKEAQNLAIKYHEKYNKKPTQEIFHEYFMLFNNDKTINNKLFIDKMKKHENFDASIVYMKSHQPFFNNYNDFLDYVFSDLEINKEVRRGG